MQNVEEIQKTLKEKNPHLSNKEVDFMIVKEGLVDGRKRTIGEMSQLFGMTITEAEKFYKNIDFKQ
jgi:hypothetical protein